MMASHTKRGIARVASAGSVLLGATVMAAAQAATPHRAVAAVANSGIPTPVRSAADLAAQTPGPEPTWVDSIFITGHVHGAGHDFGFLVHTLAFPNAGERKLYVGVTDETTGWYRNYEAKIPADEYSWSGKGLHITMPGLAWTGSAREMQINATTPWGSLKAQFKPEGPVLSYSGTGVIELLGDVNYEYAFPAMRTVGTLTAEGRARRVSGISWLDRQWGPVPVTDPSMRWTWMNISLSNGDQLAIWDVLDKRAENAWVTLQRPRGSYELAVVRPLEGAASAFWTSPVTHKSYPTRWQIAIPALNTRLSVRVTGARGQEFPDGHVEATAAVAGTYKGRKVTGSTYVEMTGDWSAPGRSSAR
jgi:hypothetical protein